MDLSATEETVPIWSLQEETKLRPHPPDDHAFVHVDVDEVRAGAAIWFPVGFWVLIGQLISSMVIGRNLHLLPAFVFLQLHTGSLTQNSQTRSTCTPVHEQRKPLQTDLGTGFWGKHQRRVCWLVGGCGDVPRCDPAPSDMKIYVIEIRNSVSTLRRLLSSNTGIFSWAADHKNEIQWLKSEKESRSFVSSVLGHMSSESTEHVIKIFKNRSFSAVIREVAVHLDQNQLGWMWSDRNTGPVLHSPNVADL